MRDHGAFAGRGSIPAAATTAPATTAPAASAAAARASGAAASSIPTTGGGHPAERLTELAHANQTKKSRAVDGG